MGKSRFCSFVGARKKQWLENPNANVVYADFDIEDLWLNNRDCFICPQ